MATTTGFVQRLKVTQSYALAYIGPTPTNTELLRVQPAAGVSDAELGVAADQIEALAEALTSRLEVTAIHPDNDNNITMLQLEP